MFARYNGVEFDIEEAHVEPLAGQLRAHAVEVHGPPGLELGAFDAADSSQISTAGIFGQNPNDFINSDGRLVGDRPVVLKTQFVYQMALGDHDVVQLPEPERQADLLGDSRDHQRVTGIPGTDRIIANVERRPGPHETLDRPSTPASRRRSSSGGAGDWPCSATS